MFVCLELLQKHQYFLTKTYLYWKALVLVNPTVLEIFWQDLYRKALVLVNPTVVEIFWQDLSKSYKSLDFGKSYSSKVWCSLFRSSYSYGHVKPISGHFFTNHINIFHKTEVQTVILSCSTYLNFNFIKRYNRKHKNVQFWVFYSFVQQNAENLCPINGHFKTISCHFFPNYIDFFQS